MIKQGIICVVVVVSLSMFTWAGSGVAVDDGEYEMTVETEVVGMQMKMPAATFNQCITQEDPVPQNDQPGQECEVKDMVTKGNTVTWTVECNAGGIQSTGQGKATYSKDTMEGSMTMSTQGMKMITHFKGHRIGPCKQQ
jgi:hypothetical protein